MVSDRPKPDVLALTTTIVAAYVGHNTLDTPAIDGVIRSVFTTLSSLSGVALVVVQDELKPAVAVKRSVTAEYLVCLEDGKKFKSLKRHLRSHYNLSPEEYREKWGLPRDYPMVAPNYAEARSRLAKKMGLGTRREK